PAAARSAPAGGLAARAAAAAGERAASLRVAARARPAADIWPSFTILPSPPADWAGLPVPCHRVYGVTSRLVVLVSGEGTNLQALIDACRDEAYGAKVVAVGADRPGITALDRAERAGIPAFILRLADYPGREEWDAALARTCAGYQPDLIVRAGSMRLVGKPFLEAFGGRCLNTHPALLPSFPGTHGRRDALAH